MRQEDMQRNLPKLVVTGWSYDENSPCRDDSIATVYVLHIYCDIVYVLLCSFITHQMYNLHVLSVILKNCIVSRWELSTIMNHIAKNHLLNQHILSCADPHDTADALVPQTNWKVHASVLIRLQLCIIILLGINSIVYVMETLEPSCVHHFGSYRGSLFS